LFSKRSLLILSFISFCGLNSEAQGLRSQDLYRLRSVTDVQFSPDARHIAYSVSMNDRPGRPYTQVWIMGVASGKSVRVGGERDSSSHPRWSPDGQTIAFLGGQGDKTGLNYVHADGSGQTFLAEITGTNSPLPGQGEEFTWSPDGKTIAYVSSIAGPETQAAAGDPMVISRYLYKPTASEGMTHFNDNKRLHLFAVDLASKQLRQLTTGNYDEHSVAWSQDGQEILFCSNREPNSDEFFNYDVFALKVSDGSIRRITATESTEYAPQWSPDGKTIAFLGTKRGLTDRETTMEDTHAWLMDGDGSNRREIGAAIDNRQQALHWAADGSCIYVTFQERGSIHLARFPVAGGQPEILVNEPGAVGAYSVSKDGKLAFALATTSDLAELYLKDSGAAARQMTSLNTEVLAGKTVASTESFRFVSNDNKFEVEAFLTKPLGMTASSKHPLRMARTVPRSISRIKPTRRWVGPFCKSITAAQQATDRSLPMRCLAIRMGMKGRMFCMA
jgi:Tol biopolymer transport system component